MSPTEDYKTRIYNAYRSRGSECEPVFDRLAAERRARLLARILKGWLADDRDLPIADLGCGTGEVLYFLKGCGYTRVAGVDISPEQVKAARQVMPDVVEADLFDFLDRHQEDFGLIFALDLLEHLRKEQVLRFLDASHRALRDGGRLILQTPNADSPMASALRYGDFTHEVCFTPSALGWLLNLAGFTGVESREGGPRPLGFLSLGRTLLWRLIRRGIQLWNLAETGSAGSGIYTRVFLVSGIKR
ncbi:MAG: class I SAM-dependent methyltransferase [bacterium]|nr:class I SAM-dependent methyltransferase [bacterium]